MKTRVKIKTGFLAILILIFFSGYSQVYAQQKYGVIKGVVIDNNNGESLPFVNVVVKSKSLKIAGVTTDSDGKYKIDSISPGVYDVSVSYLGYESFMSKGVKVSPGKITYLNFSMKPSNVKVEEVVIEEFATPLIQKDEVSSQSVVYNRGKRYHKHRRISKNKMSYSPANYNTEAYAPIVENNFKQVKASPLSTFSIDVDAASYSNIRRFIMNGQVPPKDAVRIEEMINYFNYDYPNPKDEQPFSITTEMSDCPWNSKNKLIHIGLQGKKLEMDQLPPSNFVFLLDVSGSMGSPNKLPLLKKSLSLMVNNLTAQDRVAIVVYAGSAGLVLNSTPGNQKEKILGALDRLNAGGSTAGGQGIKLAYKVAMENFINDGNNRVILATDGDFNIGASSDGEMMRLIESKRASGVYLTCLGFGMGNYKDSKMETLADKGNGNYAYIDNILEAKKVLVTEMGGTMHTIAKDVKLQLEFNPSKIYSYKLIGYENRLLNDEDFNDDTKDAGELGSGHTVTALYEVVLKGGDDGRPAVDPLRYQTKEMIGKDYGDEYLTVKFRYKEPKENSSRLIVKRLKGKIKPLNTSSDNFRFSAAVAEYGLLLRNSKHKANASFKEVLSLAKGAKGKDVNGYRAEFIRLVEMSQLQMGMLMKK